MTKNNVRGSVSQEELNQKATLIQSAYKKYYAMKSKAAATIQNWYRACKEEVVVSPAVDEYVASNGSFGTSAFDGMTGINPMPPLGVPDSAFFGVAGNVGSMPPLGVPNSIFFGVAENVGSMPPLVLPT